MSQKLQFLLGLERPRDIILNKHDKPNQDRMLITSKFNDAPHQWIFSVFDGHGVDGHKVSQFVRDNLCNYILKQKIELLVMARKTDKYYKANLDSNRNGEDSLIYYSSVGDCTEINNSKEYEVDYEKLQDEFTIFRQIQNYTKNVLIKKTFENLNNQLK
jgi:hypothetical protein